MACLIITESSDEQLGRYFQLGHRTLAAGRDPAREIQILDPKVSRKHFLIRKDGDGHLIVETNARNGILINGVQVKEKNLMDTDTIQVGDTILTYYASDMPDRTDAILKYRARNRQHREDRTVTE